jgi:hypothetical protein
MPRSILTALACAALAAPLAAQPHTGVYVVRLGKDTVAVERFSRSAPNEYQVEQALASPTSRLFHTHIALAPSGDVASVFYMQHSIANPTGPLVASTQVAVTGDSATLVAKRGDSTLAPRKVAGVAGALPTLPTAFFGFELAAMRVLAAKQDRMSVAFLGPNGVLRYTAFRVGADSMVFDLQSAPLTYRAKIDPTGRILGMHARGSTFQIVLERVASADPTAIATKWAAGPAMGAYSPADSAALSVGGASVGVRYSRPAKRGRVVFGDSGLAMEPYGKVWRTGANEATRFTTDRDLLIGDATVPAGTYTLWTHLDRAGWKLIVNKQILRPDGSGRPLWGTMYDATQDLVKVPMTMSRLASPLEQMRIALEPQGAGAVLRVQWDTTQASVPLRAK